MKVLEILTETEELNWLSQIKKHHREIKAAFTTAIENPSQANINRVKTLVLAHSVAEEASVYPTLVKHGISDTNLEHEQDGAKAEVRKLASKWNEPDIQNQLKKLLKGVLTHAIQHEEKNKFKKLFAKLDKEQNGELTAEYKKHYK